MSHQCCILLQFAYHSATKFYTPLSILIFRASRGISQLYHITHYIHIYTHCHFWRRTRVRVYCIWLTQISVRNIWHSCSEARNTTPRHCGVKHKWRMNSSLCFLPLKGSMFLFFCFFFINRVQITSKQSSITSGGGCITTNACGKRMKGTHKKMGLQRGDSTTIYIICSNKPTKIAPHDYYHLTYNEGNSLVQQ